jgi:hypothetical protein
MHKTYVLLPRPLDTEAEEMELEIATCGTSNPSGFDEVSI